MATLTLKNGTTKAQTGLDSLKFCIYNEKDLVKAIPVEGGVGSLENGQTTEWTKAAGDKYKSYTIIWFKAQFIDKKLASGTAPIGGSCEIYYDKGYHTRTVENLTVS